jgi:hypothetical protein
MKIVKVLGGLGNQMFQYAFYLAMKKKFGEVKIGTASFKGYSLHNGYELERIFDINPQHASNLISKIYDPIYNQWHIRKLRKLLGLKRAYFEEKKWFDFDPQILKQATKNMLYWGYWQNENYFIELKDEIIRAFAFKLPLSAKNEAIASNISSFDSVGLHVRRGDYLTNEFLGGLCSADYYRKAIDVIGSRVQNPTYFIFSNDIEWCKENLNVADAHYINWNTGLESYVDMQLMSLCKHQIIANSSFSWWAAWLNKNPEKIVIAPKVWANGIDNNEQVCPNTWLRLS